MLERIQKILSARGIASRRKAEEYILQGLVLVNGQPAKLGQKADPATDRIEVRGEVMEARREMLYFVMNKPKGVVTSNVDSFTRLFVEPNRPLGERLSQHQTNKPVNEQTKKRSPTIRALLPPHLRGKIYPVGRLDKDSTGLLLLTNDGVLAYRLTHPKFDHEKEYEVETEEEITNGQLQKMRDGLMILGEKTKPATVERTGKRNFRIALTEGKNRQIRRMSEKVGCTVKELKRVRIVTLQDRRLQAGSLRALTKEEREELLAVINIKG